MARLDGVACPSVFIIHFSYAQMGVREVVPETKANKLDIHGRELCIRALSGFVAIKCV